MKNVFVVGEINLDNFLCLLFLLRNELVEFLNIDLGKKWILMIYYLVIKESCEKNFFDVNSLFYVFQLLGDDYEILVFKFNIDLYGLDIN